MAVTLTIQQERCIRCMKCVTVCPSRIFSLNKADKAIETNYVDTCISCGHCVAVCPEDAIRHSNFPASKIHPVDANLLPTPEQMMLLCKSRRSNRAMTNRPIPEDSLQQILEAAHRAPTGSNVQHVKFLLVTDHKLLHQISEFTLGVFDGLLKLLRRTGLLPIIKRMAPELGKYVPVFDRMSADFKQGDDQVLRKATAVLFIYTPKGARMGVLDANLAYQNASLMAECLGVCQFYTGFVLNAAEMKKGKLEKLLGIDGQIHAGMAMGMPQFTYPNYIDRKDIEVEYRR